MASNWRTSLAPIFKSCFFCGVVLFAMGNVMTFVPGAEVTWFLQCAGFLLPGRLLGKRTYVGTAAILMVWCLILGSHGHKRGLEYQQWEQARRSATDSQR